MNGDDCASKAETQLTRDDRLKAHMKSVNSHAITWKRRQWIERARILKTITIENSLGAQL